MSSFFGGSSSSATSPAPAGDVTARKEAIMASVKNEMALAGAQELINKTNEKCYAKCVTNPSTSLSGSEQTCLTRCLDRYMEAFNIVSRTYTTRLVKERLENPASTL